MTDGPSENYINYDNVVKTFLPTDRSITSVNNATTYTIPRNDQRTGLTIENDVANTGVTTITDTSSGTVWTLGPGGSQNWSKKKNDLPILSFTWTHSVNGEKVRVKEW